MAKKSKTSGGGNTPAPSGWQGYLHETCGLPLSLLFIAPLLIVYEVGLMLIRPERHSWAGGVVRETFFNLLGSDGMVVLNVVVLATVLAGFWWLKRRRSVHIRYYPVLLAESAVYAFFFGWMVLAVIDIAQLPVAMGRLPNAMGKVADNVVLSIGAGVYEEIVFRLLLMTGICMLVRKGWDTKPSVAAGLAVVISSLIFAACHHIGPAGDPFRWYAFSFRLVSGSLFGVIYLCRGLAVAAYTHAFYDIIVTLGKT